QMPLRHASVRLHALPSSQLDPSAFATTEQAPVAGSQLPTWHWSAPVQLTGVPKQTPATHWSPVEQICPSLQLVPSAFGPTVHSPVVTSQLTISWHWSSPAQLAGGVPPHTPAWHTSPTVHALPSLQLLPSASAGFEQAPVAGL